MPAFSIAAVNQQGAQHQVTIDKDPDHCPICNHGVDAKKLGLNYSERESLERVFMCPRDACQHIFVARYQRNPSSGWFYLRQLVPNELPVKQYSEVIAAISKDFCEIDAQADKCERLGFTLVAGPGYRKGLEFLVKDYLCGLHPNDKAEIEKFQLGACISKFVKNDNIKITASRAAWLGNDETHYVRKWDDKDLQDLKKLIALTQHWIEMEELTKQFVSQMPAGKP